MAATFNANLADPISKVRQKIGDTDTTNVEVQDETITAYLTEKGGVVLQVAHQLALDLAAKYARYADTTVDDQLTRFKHVYDNYIKLADRLGKEIAALAPTSPASAAQPGIYVGGIGDCRGPLDSCCDDVYGYGGRYQ